MKTWYKKFLAQGGSIIYFMLALEIAIMISPFALFFYSVFNPVFHFLGQYHATRWLTGFFFTHMIYPPGIFLQSIRIIGSIFFVFGLGIFAICALQVYLIKIFNPHVVTKGLYRIIRHPQYSELSVCGIGMAILWPRFITLLMLAMMISLYYFLAKDEERRMINQYGENYKDYMSKTGMFFAKRIEQPVVNFVASCGLKPYSKILFPVAIIGSLLASGLILRAITVAKLPVQTEQNIAVVSVLPEDNIFSKTAASRLGKTEESIPLNRDETYVGYLMPVNYVMQGMIANTGEYWHLYKRHHTFQMIIDWVFHPFGHLRHAPLHQMPSEDINANVRRVILVRVEIKKGEPLSAANLFALEVKRTPVAYLDMDVISGEIIKAHKVDGTTAWKGVPTPIF
jgi:protein-S-isoprenylcysteine O-methyltransferase Ste14